jgi:outer membrane protein TolC
VKVPSIAATLATPLILFACGGALAAESYPALLPPEDTVRACLQQLPEIRAAQAQMDLAAAEARRLRAGPYEWTATATAQRREADSTRYREGGLSLERPLRWFGKSSKDAAMGDQKIRVAEYGYADAWHEAGRSFQKIWFDAMREAGSAALLERQVSLHQRQVEIVLKRVRAGDAPRMELMLAEAERDRAAVAQRQAAQRAARAAGDLRRRCLGIEIGPPDPALQPEPATRGGADWLREMVTENHEIALAEGEAELAKLAAQRSSLDRMPDPTVGVHMMQERDRQEKIVGITVSIPLPGGARRAQSDASAAEAVVAQQKAQQVRQRVEREASAAVMADEAAYENWQRLAALAERSRENAALVSKAYSLGEVPIGETLLAQRQSLEAAAGAMAAQLDAFEARARLLLDAHVFWNAFSHDGHEH